MLRKDFNTEPEDWKQWINVWGFSRHTNAFSGCGKIITRYWEGYKGLPFDKSL